MSIIKKRLTALLVLCAVMLSACGAATPPAATSAPAENSADTGAEPGKTQEVREESVAQGETAEEAPAAERVILGNERFEEYLPLLEGKRVALFTNQTGIVGNLEGGAHILDALIERGVNVTAVFSPEHGFRGTADAGALVDDSVDEKTGVPLLSLYASDETHAPSDEDMEVFDVLVIDMQDVGLRYYTYYISMYYLMDACAAHEKEVIVLDRPNPNGSYVDGALLRMEYRSGVGQLPIPVVYGMTWGELSQMINGEGWLATGKDACDLTVIPCLNYTHATRTALIVNPSPNIRSMRAVYLYASLCFFENTLVSVGRGTDHPFEIYGSPYLEGAEGYDYSFTPRSVSGASAPPFEGVLCYGKDLGTISEEEILSRGINLDYLIDAHHAVTAAHPEESFWGTPDHAGRYWIDLLSGSDALRTMVDAGMSAEEIEASWQEDIDAFLTQREPYLLYP